MENPMDYSLCSQTVTLYRLQEQQVKRQVLENCYLEHKTQYDTDARGSQMERAFLLIVPSQGHEQVAVLPGDRIYEGTGPVIDGAQWRSFIPANVPQLMQVQYVQPCFFAGRLCHTEAGRKSHGLAR